MKVRFTDCVELVGEAPKNYTGEKIYVSTGAVNCNEIDQAQTESVSFDNRPSRANLVVEEDAILFAKMQNTHKVLLVNADLKEHIYSTGFCAVRAKEQFLTKECLFYLLNSPQFLSQKDKYCSGATQKAITNEALSKLTVNIPDMAEQEYVVKNLNKTSKLIEKHKQQLEKLDLLVKSKFDEMFGDCLNGTRGWDKYELNEICDVRDGTHDSPEYHSVGVPLITSKNITGGYLDFTTVNFISEEDATQINKRSKVDKGDILLPMIGTVGGAVIVDTEPYFCIKNVALIKFTKSQTSNIFIREYLNSAPVNALFDSIKSGGTQKFVGLGTIRKLTVSVPPLELQNEFARFVEQTYCVKLSIKHSLNKLEVLKKALMQKYFG